MHPTHRTSPTACPRHVATQILMWPCARNLLYSRACLQVVEAIVTFVSTNTGSSASRRITTSSPTHHPRLRSATHDQSSGTRPASGLVFTSTGRSSVRSQGLWLLLAGRCDRARAGDQMEHSRPSARTNSQCFHTWASLVSLRGFPQGAARQFGCQRTLKKSMPCARPFVNLISDATDITRPLSGDMMRPLSHPDDTSRCIRPQYTIYTPMEKFVECFLSRNVPNARNRTQAHRRSPHFGTP